ncbi:hypothetical protein MKX08_002674 [Trichoderma sp. CBMAI-0020]|nr:hypothetical protein MKX08_002674 [Trichoderma sp. CBMAI-0020]
MDPLTIKSVLVIGPNGNVGKSTIKALLDEKFDVTGLSRTSSEATLPSGVRHVKSDYSEASLREIFKGQDAVISTISSIVVGDALASQKAIINAAIAAGVKVFFPSEYGIDTSDRSASAFVPFLADKIETMDYLKANQDKISWTALVTGSMFDWGLNIPGFGGWNLSTHSASIFDGGDIPYEATNLDQVGRGIAKCLKNPGLTRNQHVYVNSFTITQNEVLKALEKNLKKEFTVSEGSVEQLWEEGASQVKAREPLSVLSMLSGAIYGKGNLAHFSSTRGLWNDRLNLPQESLGEFLGDYLAKKV